jgi:hypothetical protein
MFISVVSLISIITMSRTSDTQSISEFLQNLLHRELVTRVHSYKKNALTKNREFSLTFGECERLFVGRCYYCGEPPKSKLNGIDRVENDQGYHIGNVVSCCWMCNKMKGTMDMTEFVSRCKKIAGLKTSKYFA